MKLGSKKQPQAKQKTMKRGKPKKTPPKPDPNELLEIEALVGKRRLKRKNEYLVKWKVRGAADYSWEPQGELPSWLVKQYDETSHEVEALLDTRQRNGKNEYLIKWKNAAAESWEPELNIDRELVVDFEFERARGKAKTHIQLKKGRDPKHNRKKSPAPTRKVSKRLVKKEPIRATRRLRSGSTY